MFAYLSLSELHERARPRLSFQWSTSASASMVFSREVGLAVTGVLDERDSMLYTVALTGG